MLDILLPHVLPIVTILLSVFAAASALRKALLGTRVELKIRDKLDEFASKDRKFNIIMKDANSSFLRGMETSSLDDVRAFRNVLTTQVENNLQEDEKLVLRSITDKSDRHLERYSERMAHSIAGRRTFWGRLVDRYIRFLIRIFR
jgi:hypothetical protein